jgi:4-hydroxy-3-methylbut-2-enyl diphosphate reductase
VKIVLSKYAGFCGGIERAYEMAMKASESKKTKKPIFMLGSLAHNEDVVRKIEESGIKKIKFDGNLKKLFDSKRKIGTLIITAHGIGPKIYELCRQKEIDIIDTTCPKVVKVQRLAELFSRKGEKTIIIGGKKHKEVKGTKEWSGRKAIVIENEKDLKNIKWGKNEKINIISQTTQNERFIKKFISLIKAEYPSSKFINTICLTTSNRQKEVRMMAKKCDVMIIIGSPRSSNSTNLWKISKEINPRSHFIERSENIDEKWLKNSQKIGITAGASVPSWVINEVCLFLKKKL